MHKKSLEAQDTLNGGKDSLSQSHSSDEERSSNKLPSSLNVISPTSSPSTTTKGYPAGFAGNTEAFRYYIDLVMDIIYEIC